MSLSADGHAEALSALPPSSRPTPAGPAPAQYGGGSPSHGWVPPANGAGGATVPHYGNGSLAPTDTRSTSADVHRVADLAAQLFVGNLPFRVRWQDCKDLFRKCGTVLRADVALTPSDQRSRGHGVVLFSKREDAYRAIEVYNGYCWQSRILDVHLDLQDPQGVLAISEANRQTALQQQAQHYQVSAMQQQQQVQYHQAHYLQQQQPLYSLAQQQTYGLPPQAFMPSPYYPQASLAQVLSHDHTSPPTGHSTPDPASPDTPPSTTTSHSAGTSETSEISGVAPFPSLPHHYEEPVSMSGTQHQYASMIGQSQMGLSMQLANGGANFSYIPPPPPPPPGALNGLMPYIMQQQQLLHQQQLHVRGGSDPSTSNRHLFVGNLPFNCQWQELKDLMRAAGAVLRADVAQADGRSRGFGSVLFESAESSQRAVSMFNGYDYNGRILKVHFDKFSQNVPGQGLTHLGSSSMPSMHQPYEEPYPEMVQPQPHMFVPPSPFPLHFPPSSAFGPSPLAKVVHPHDIEETDSEPPTLASTPKTTRRAPAPSLGRIAMPPPLSFGPMSPMQQGRLPLMTPSMPAFTLGAYPQTPPLYPHMFSPGLGAFSPGIIPMPMRGGYGNGGHIMNPAPGAPLHRGASYNLANSTYLVASPHMPYPPTYYEAPTPRASDHPSDLSHPTSRRGSGEDGYFPVVLPEATPTNGAIVENGNALGVPVSLRGTVSAPGTRLTSPQARSPVPSPPVDPALDTTLSALNLDSMSSAIKADEAEAEAISHEEDLRNLAQMSGNGRRRSHLENSGSETLKMNDVRRASFESSMRSRPAFGSSIWAGEPNT